MSWELIKVLELGINPDHVHLFISAYPTIPIHKIVKRIKGRSLNILRKEFPELLKLPSLWTHSYYVSTIGALSKEAIEKYIEALKVFEMKRTNTFIVVEDDQGLLELADKCTRLYNELNFVDRRTSTTRSFHGTLNTFMRSMLQL